MKIKKSNPFPYGKFCFADFCGDQAKLDKKRTETGRHPDRKKCPKTGQPDKAFVQERLQKCRETFSLTPVHRMEGMETERSGAHGAKARYRRSDLRGRAPDKSALKMEKQDADTGRPVFII